MVVTRSKSWLQKMRCIGGNTSNRIHIARPHHYIDRRRFKVHKRPIAYHSQPQGFPNPIYLRPPRSPRATIPRAQKQPHRKHSLRANIPEQWSNATSGHHTHILLHLNAQQYICGTEFLRESHIRLYIMGAENDGTRGRGVLLVGGGHSFEIPGFS